MARKIETIEELSEKILKLEKRKKAMQDKRVLSLGKITEKHLKAGLLGLSNSEYLRMLAKGERQVLPELLLLKREIAKVQSLIFEISQMSFRAYRYGWFCAFALKEERIKQVQLKIEQELRTYNNQTMEVENGK